MSLSVLFQELGAPLVNPGISWGAVRERDRTVLLRVWEDEHIKFPDVSNNYFFWIANSEHKNLSPGYPERRQHLELIRNGYRALMVVAHKGEPTADGPTVQEWDDRELRVGGILLDRGGDIWLESVGRISTAEAKAG